jgi:hypothetical protein
VSGTIKKWDLQMIAEEGNVNDGEKILLDYTRPGLETLGFCIAWMI